MSNKERPVDIDRSPAMRVSVVLRQLAGEINEWLTHTAGKRLGFALIVSVDETAQYVSNCSRQDGMEMLDSLLSRWRAGEADIPAHDNPDLKEASDATEVRNDGEGTDEGRRNDPGRDDTP